MELFNLSNHAWGACRYPYNNVCSFIDKRRTNPKDKSCKYLCPNHYKKLLYRLCNQLRLGLGYSRRLIKMTQESFPFHKHLELKWPGGIIFPVKANHKIFSSHKTITEKKERNSHELESSSMKPTGTRSHQEDKSDYLAEGNRGWFHVKNFLFDDFLHSMSIYIAYPLTLIKTLILFPYLIKIGKAKIL